MSATFAQTSFNPPLVIINPNRMHSLEPAIAETGRFAINVMPKSSRELVARLMRMRRREPEKHRAVGLLLDENEQGVPFITTAQHVLFCEVERAIPSGDRKLYVARVTGSHLSSESKRERPLLFFDIHGAGSSPPPLRTLRTGLIVSGALDLVKNVKHRLRPPSPANIALTTFQDAGATEEEIEEVLKYGPSDRSRQIEPPVAAPAKSSAPIGVCTVGTGWGGVHCRYLRQANPNIRLFVCGRNPERTSRFARDVGAEDFFTDLETAAQDPRVQAMTLALPHDLHRQAAEIAASAGKAALVEKPIATNLSDAEAMISKAKSANTILMVAEDMHFRPAIREAVASIKRGDVGEPLYLIVHAGGIRRPEGWAADKDRMGGGVLIDIGVHYIRGLRLLMGEPDRVLATRAMQVNTKMKGEDSVQLIFASKFGWQAHMLLTWSSPRGNIPDIILSGDNGTLHLWPGQTYLDYYAAAPRVIPNLISYVRPFWLQEKLFRPNMQRKRIQLADEDGTGYLGEMQEFLNAVTEKRPPIVTAETAARDLQIVLLAYTSLQSGNWVEIP